MPLELGQGSGDFRETRSRIQLFHVGVRNALGIATPDAFTQANPPVVPTVANVSTTLAGITSLGVLGATVAFTRPDAGNGFIGGPVLIATVYQARQKPLGLFLNDAVGNPYENTPAVASGRIPYCSAMSVVGVTLWETQIQIGASTDLTYNNGDFVYASVNGLLTNRIEDAYQYRVIGQSDPDFVTVMGVVKVAPDASNSLMVLDMRV
jgi:hypothetical protein